MRNWGEGVRQCLMCGRELSPRESWRRLCADCQLLDAIERAMMALRDVREALAASRSSELVNPSGGQAHPSDLDYSPK